MYNYYSIAIILLAAVNFGSSAQIASSYGFESTIYMGEAGESVGYRIEANINFIYKNDLLLLAKFQDPKLQIMSRKAPTPQGFVYHKSKLDETISNPFLIKFQNDLIDQLYFAKNEEPALIQLKKGIASLLQFSTKDGKVEETDTSGICKVNYKINDNEINKEKLSCTWPGKFSLNGKLWGSSLDSQRNTKIILDQNIVKSIVSTETHILKSSISNMMQIMASTVTSLNSTASASIMDKSNLDVASIIKKLEQEYSIEFESHNISPEIVKVKCPNMDCLDITKLIKKYKSSLSSKELGKTKSATALIKAVDAAKISTFDEIYKVLSTANKDIIPQILDILGAAQTNSTHQAALKFLKINTKNYNLDFCERYFWALSLSPHPQENIIHELLQMVNKEHEDDKLWQTIVLTLSAMVYRYNKLNKDNELERNTIDFLNNKIKECEFEDEICIMVYLRGFSNIPTPVSIDKLIDYTNLLGKPGFEAIKAISKLEPKLWTKNVIKMAERVFLANATHDSSSRTVALDILLASEPNDLSLAKILSILKFNDSPKELKQYLFERLAQISQSDKSFENRYKKILRQEGLYNYNILAQGGLSTAFSRSFMDQGSLSTSQEVVNGIVKQGNVNVNLNIDGKEISVFTLGIFARGLNSFVSDGGDSDDEASAGLQLTVHDVDLRPFVFFNGQGELMGHVWSGTASDLTPAYQALLLLENDQIILPLGTGGSAFIRFRVGASLNLAGKIEISLWNRNANSLVKNEAGLVFNGDIIIFNSFVRTKIEFNLYAEPKLELSSNVEFSSNAAMCLMLQQPTSTIKYNTFKIERIAESKHKLRKSKYKTINVPGKTYSLNAKNNEMCSAIFQ